MARPANGGIEDMFTVARAESHRFLALLSGQQSLNVLLIETSKLDASSILGHLDLAFPTPKSMIEVMEFQTFLHSVDFGQTHQQSTWNSTVTREPNDASVDIEVLSSVNTTFPSIVL